jgi:hypothetical protein
MGAALPCRPPRTGAQTFASIPPVCSRRWLHVLAGPLRPAGAGLPPPPPSGAIGAFGIAFGRVPRHPPAPDHLHCRPSPLAVPHFVSTGGVSVLRRERHIAYPSCSLFPGAAIVRSPLLLMRRC